MLDYQLLNDSPLSRLVLAVCLGNFPVDVHVEHLPGTQTSPLYKFTFDTTFSTLGWATTSVPYRLGAQLIYPFVQPVADPAIETVNKSKVVHQVRTKQG